MMCSSAVDAGLLYVPNVWTQASQHHRKCSFKHFELQAFVDLFTTACERLGLIPINKTKVLNQPVPMAPHQQWSFSPRTRRRWATSRISGATSQQRWALMIWISSPRESAYVWLIGLGKLPKSIWKRANSFTLSFIVRENGLWIPHSHLWI